MKFDSTLLEKAGFFKMFQ